MDDIAHRNDRPEESAAGRRRPTAGRVRLPWWYRVVVRVLLMALLAVPVAAGYAHERAGLVAALLSVPLLVAVNLLHHRVLSTVSGVRVARDSFDVYPTSRPAAFTFIAVVVIGEVLATAAAHVSTNVTEPVAVVLSAAVVAAWCLNRHADAVIREIARRDASDTAATVSIGSD